MGSSSSSNSITQLHLTEDIYSEIFLHLPIDSIYEFRCVCKVWFSLLSDPNFIKTWNKLNLSVWTLILLDKQHTQDNSFIRFFTFAYPKLHSEFISHHHQNGFSLGFLNQKQNFNQNVNLVDGLFIIGSSNGLVLITTDLFNQKSYYVCNPLTEIWVLLPPPPPREDNWVVTGFLCNDDECFSKSTSYKVIQIPPMFSAAKEFKLEMFSSDLGEWSIYDVSCPPNVTWAFGKYDNLVAHNGVLYWFQKESCRILAVSGNRNNDKNDGGCGNEECRLISLPDRVMDGADKNITQCIGESEGFICYTIIKETERTLSVWVLLEAGWYLLHRNIIFHGILAEMESLFNGGAGAIDLIKGIQVLGFNPVDKSVVILGCNKYIWADNTRTKGYEQLRHPSFLGSNISVLIMVS
ncbi:uncharacterized protein LOC113351109 [Papaver somniferum]|uniref:uncharacterized protein LOC113351109 n=1 Tax=Papaver somniferum TaxID=3469 RepID=UPI000E70567B|nr:uncharacterized protein LOC113351109 [Papaver somniferum]